MIDRRQFLHMMGIAGLTASPALMAFQKNALAGAGHAHGDGFLEDRPDYTHKRPDYFDADTRRLVGWVAETIIPATDTPGAIDANVHTFIELMARDWMEETERFAFMAGLEGIDKRAQATAGTPFVSCSEDRRLEILMTLEEEQKDHPWFNPGSASGFENKAPFIAQLKELVVTGFFMSDVGSNHVLRPNIFPGFYEGDIALDPEESSWASVPRM